MNKKSGGRKKGSLNKDKAGPREMAQKLGIDPLEVLLLLAGGKWKELGFETEQITVKTMNGSNEEYRIPITVRANAAGQAAKYMYSQLRTVEGNVNHKGISCTIIEKMDGGEVIMRAEKDED